MIKIDDELLFYLFGRTENTHQDGSQILCWLWHEADTNSSHDCQSPCHYLTKVFPQIRSKSASQFARRFLCDIQVCLVTSHSFAGTASEADKRDFTNIIIHCGGHSRWCVGTSSVRREFEEWLPVGGGAEKMVADCVGRERLRGRTYACCWHHDTGPVPTRAPAVPDGAWFTIPVLAGPLSCPVLTATKQQSKLPQFLYENADITPVIGHHHFLLNNFLFLSRICLTIRCCIVWGTDSAVKQTTDKFIWLCVTPKSTLQ
jgi:hypothetical protein